MSKSLSEYRQEYFEASTKVSEINRNLALAGVVIVWSFVKYNEEKDVIRIAYSLKIALIFIVFSLIVDLTQYIWRTITIARFYSNEEKKIDNKESKKEKQNAFADVSNFPSWIRITTWCIFSLKIALMVIGYIFIMYFLMQKI